MSTGYVGEIRIFAGDFAPHDWAFCDGRLLAIAENDTLYNLIKTTYGGDGINNFALPDLRGRLPLTAGQGPGLSDYPFAAQGGSETMALSVSQLPAHRHSFNASLSSANMTAPVGTYLATAQQSGTACYVTSGQGNDAPLNPATLETTGGAQAHQNMMPSLALNFIICLSGDYPNA
jgi:microcystin-dependent protein